jgi:hypothetical protein
VGSSAVKGKAMSETDFRVSLAGFKRKHEFVGRVLNAIASNSVANQDVEARRGWTNLLCSRLWTIGHSLLSLCGSAPIDKSPGSFDTNALDHSSIAALARALLEAWVMFVYFSDPTISETEWILRKTILELYDQTTRYKILKYIGDRKSDQAQEFRDGMAKLKL